MPRQITIDPVTRIEGHAKITIYLNDDGTVEDARFHVTQYRGFEKLCEGRPFSEMPSLMARTCGICPVSHLIASSKACDALLAVSVPRTGRLLRRLLNLGQIVQSHALSFFHLSSPDFLLGMDAPPEKRNLFALVGSHPTIAHDGIALRKFGQQVIERLAGKRIHPAWCVPGGVSEPLEAEQRDAILAEIPQAMAIATRTIEWYKKTFRQFSEEIATFANFPSLFMGLVDEDGNLEFTNGKLRVVDSAGNIIADQLEIADYPDFIGESVESYSYLKSPYYKPLGYPDGMYRVGPLARLNIVDRCNTPRADEEWAEFRELDRRVVLSSFHYHYARLIEIIACLEQMEKILSDPDILDTHVRAHAEPNAYEGVGVSEAPRGTLLHHYRIDRNGLITWANLIIATGNNNLAMNRGVLQAAKYFVRGEKIEEGMLNRVEAVIRCYDPCLSCSTHAVGQMPLEVQLVGPDGAVLDSVRRD